MKRKKIIQALKEKGFTGEFQLFYWANDGWYIHYDQMQHQWGGQHWKHVLEQIKEGLFDPFLPTNQS